MEYVDRPCLFKLQNRKSHDCDIIYLLFGLSSVSEEAYIGYVERLGTFFSQDNAFACSDAERIILLIFCRRKLLLT